MENCKIFFRAHVIAHEKCGWMFRLLDVNRNIYLEIYQSSLNLEAFFVSENVKYLKSEKKKNEKKSHEVWRVVLKITWKNYKRFTVHEKLLADILDLDKSRNEWSEEFRCGEESKIVSELKYMKNSISYTHYTQIIQLWGFSSLNKMRILFSLKTLGRKINLNKKLFCKNILRLNRALSR